MKDKYLGSIVFIKFVSLICFFMVLSCSAEEEDTIPPTSTVQSTIPEPETETFENWTPDFTNQTTNFTQTRTGSNGTEQTRIIDVSSTSNSTYSNEGNIYQDINGDGDIEDSVEIINITYVASENLGQFDSVNVNVNLNNETTIFEFNYETFPTLPPGGEGMGYISLNSKHYILLPFVTNTLQIKVTLDYLRIFEIDSTDGKLHDRTFSIYDEVPEIGFPKGPLFVEDFDNDGFDDLFLVDHGLENSFINNRFEGDFLKFYYGSENGFIKDETEISNLKLYYHHADVSDFDLDGDLDIISQRWGSQTLEVPGSNSITLFKNLGNRNYEIIDLESPPAGVGSVLFSNIDDDPELEVLSFGYGGGVVWSWDILENKTEIINNQLGTYKIHDVVEIENNDSSSIIIFPEDFQGIETPTFISTDKCENISSFDILNDFQGRDIYVIDLNNDGLDDLFMYDGTDGEYPTPSARSFVNSVLINQGNNQFSYPSNVTDTYNKSYNDEKTDNRYVPLKQTSNGYLFFKFGDFSNNGIYPINGKLIDLSFN
ncbi:VCBS repeat-containing protein [Flavobacteriaceae bacterium]|nr:VCBS repeat-containing protein [Flavobacteriaceae bacterium]